MRDVRRTADDVAYELGSYPVTIVAPLPGRAGLVAVEVPRAERRIVHLDELPPASAPLTFPLGLGLDGEAVFCDLANRPHLVVAGQTGSGKSSLVHAMLCSLLSRLSADEVRFVLIDAKQVELTRYESIPHLLAPVATDVEEALRRLRGTVRLMELRYAALRQYGCRSIAEINAKLEAAGRLPIPYVVLIVDELAHLVLAARKQAEALIVRLAQKARAVGIHLVLATQSPRVGIVSGLIGANIPTRIAFKVAKQVDSYVILDADGAQQLLGNGDGLLSMPGAPPVRFQAPLVEAEEIDAICGRWRDHG